MWIAEMEILRELRAVVVGAVEVLHPTAVEAEPGEFGEDFFVLFASDKTAKLWMIAHGRSGPILRHQRDVHRRRKLFGEEAQNSFAILDGTGQNQMANDESRLGDTIVVEPKVTSLLTEHLLESGSGDLRIARRSRVAASEGFIHILEVGQIDCDGALEFANRFDAIIAAIVEDVAQAWANVVEGADHDFHLGDEMRRRDEADQVDAAIEDGFDASEDIGKVGKFLLGRLAVAADFVVLAIDALHVAAIEEDVADTAWAGKYGFLAAVWEDRGDGKTDAALAETELGRVAVGMAIARADGAVGKFGQGREDFGPGEVGVAGMHRGKVNDSESKGKQRAAISGSQRDAAAPSPLLSQEERRRNLLRDSVQVDSQ